MHTLSERLSERKTSENINSILQGYDDSELNNEEEDYQSTLLLPDIVKCKNCDFPSNNHNYCGSVKCVNCGHKLLNGSDLLQFDNNGYIIESNDKNMSKQKYVNLGLNKSNQNIDDINNKMFGDVVEHMTSESTDNSNDNTIAGFAISLSSWVCLVIIGMLIAHIRCELTMSSALCIVIFPQLYLCFALVDFAVFKYSSTYKKCRTSTSSGTSDSS